jgi:conjugal transfer ATP-binding protein TraC
MPGRDLLPPQARGNRESVGSLREAFLPERSAAADRLPRRLLREITRMPRLTGILPYVAWREDARLFALDQGGFGERESRAIGFCIEALPQTGASDEMEKVLASLFVSCPPGTGIQVSLYGSPNILPLLRAQARLLPGPDPTANEALRRAPLPQHLPHAGAATHRSLPQGTGQSLFSHQTYLLRDYRLVISITLPLDPEVPADVDAALRLRESVHATLQSAHLPGHDWTPEICWPSPAISSTTRRCSAAVAGARSRGTRPARCATSSRIGRSPRASATPTFAFGRRVATNRCCSSSRFASIRVTFACGDEHPDRRPLPARPVDAVRLPDHHGGGRPRLRVGACGARRRSRRPVRRRVRARTWRTSSPTCRSASATGTWCSRPSTAAARSSACTTRSACWRGSTTPPRCEHALRAVWRARGFDLTKDFYLQHQALAAALPMTLTPALQADLRQFGRISTKTADNAVMMSPLIAEWKGTPTPVMTLFGRRGQVLGFDLFDNTGGNFNFAVAALSGSGKSVFVNELTYRYLGAGAKVWIIDVGRSYKNLCDLLDGEFIEFSDERRNTLCLNPFSMIIDINADMEMVLPLLAQMASPREPLDNYSYTALGSAIKRVWDAKRPNGDDHRHLHPPADRPAVE